MAEAPHVCMKLNRGATVAYFNEIGHLINENSLDGIIRIFTTVHPEQCTNILNTSRDGWTPLSWAIKYNRFEISCYLLEISLRQGCREMCEIWKKTRHPLTAALAVDNPQLIQLIASSLHDINDIVHASYTPLMLAVSSGNIKYVRLMIRLGADINLANCDGRTPLMISTENFDICLCLVIRRVNLDHQDAHGDTALHLAVEEMHTESLTILVNAGADVRIRNKMGLTPLMLAGFHQKLAAVENLSINASTDLEVAEAIEGLNSCYVCAQCPVIAYWNYALQLRKGKYPKQSPYPAQDILDFSKEFTTEIELQGLKNDPLLLGFQGILVTERILGRNNGPYLCALLQVALIAKDEKYFNKLRQFIDYIQDYCKSHPTNITTTCSAFFKVLFTEIANGDDPECFIKNGGFVIFKTITNATRALCLLFRDQLSKPHINNNVCYSMLVDLFLYMTSTIMNINVAKQPLLQFHATVVKLVKEDPRVVNFNSLLHRAIKFCKTDFRGTIKLIRVLLESGADANAKDYFGRTPLMYALKYVSNDNIRETLELLLEYGSHLDCKDSEGFSVFDSARWMSLAIPGNTRSLQCRAAEVIVDNRINYERDLPWTLKEFINFHNWT